MSGISPSLGDDPTGPVLPAGLAELTEQVVRGTWLWPSEKKDLRAEIESHFREGLIELAREGLSLEESVETLRDEFGDPKLAAKLIRRGKKRGRPMFWKMMTAIGGISIGAAGLAGGYGAYLYFGKPNPTIDYVAQMNEPIMKTPEADRAWPILREALVQLKPMSPGLEPARNDLPQPGAALWPDAVQWLSANRGILPQIAAAAEKPVMGFVYDNTITQEYMRERAIVLQKPVESAVEQADPLMPPTIMILLPHLADARDVGRLLVLNARDHLMRGDFASTVQSLECSLRLGLLFLDGQTLIEQLVGAAMCNLAEREMRSILLKNAPTADQTAALRRSTFESLDTSRFRARFDGERLFYSDVAQYIFTDDGEGNGRLIPTQYAKVIGMTMAMGDSNDSKLTDAGLIALAAAHADRKETGAKYEEIWMRMKEVCSLPLFDERRGDAHSLVERELGSAENARRFAVIHALLPSLAQSDRLMREARMEAEATRAMFAIYAYRSERGMMPQRLSDLVPEFLSAEPVDLYSGSSLHYRIGPDGSPILYSIGRNLKDDGGNTEKVPLSVSGGNEHPKDIVYTAAR